MGSLIDSKKNIMGIIPISADKDSQGSDYMINSGDTAWVLISAALVFIMTPALALFYGGMVRSKNVLSTIMQSMFILGMVSVEFILIGYTLVFSS